jgi:hypothetical protein
MGLKIYILSRKGDSIDSIHVLMNQLLRFTRKNVHVISFRVKVAEMEPCIVAFTGGFSVGILAH